MQRIAIISNWDEACGLAEYSKRLTEQLTKSNFEVNVLRHCPSGEGYAAVLINYHPAIIGFTADDVKRMQGFGAKVILIVQESCASHRVVGPQDAMDIVDAVVAHEAVDISHYQGKKVPFKWIPHALPDVKVQDYVLGASPILGTAGFAFPTKHMEVTVKAAVALQGKALVIAPQHASYNASPLYQDWQALGGSSLILETGFLQQEEVIRKLSQCTALIYFAIEPYAPGQSGSSRMMAAARRPMIMKRCEKVKTLFPYEDEIYFVDTETEVQQVAAEIWKEVKAGRKVKTPHRLISDLNWSMMGQKYGDLIRELLTREVVAS